MKLTIGSAPDSWGVWFASDPRQTPWWRFLDEVREAGYDYTELGPYGYLPTDLTALRGELNRRGLTVTGSFVMGDLADPGRWPDLERQLRGWGPNLKALGAKFLVLIDMSTPTSSPASSSVQPASMRSAFRSSSIRPGGSPKLPSRSMG